MCKGKNNINKLDIEDKNVIFLDFPYSEKDKFPINNLPPKEEIIAFFLETYQGWGAWLYPKEYLKSLNSFAKENNILICFDEVQSGFYRMGTLYGYQSYKLDIKPDLLCLGKGLTSCLPLSALIGTKEIIDVNLKLDLDGTHSGNTLCCVAGIANLEILTSNSFQIELKNKIKLFEKRSKKLEKYKIVDKINTKGMITGIILKNKELASLIVKYCVKNGVLPVQTGKESIKLGPPLTITKEALNEAFDVIEEGISEFI